MELFKDEYFHLDNEVMYVFENIPGPLQHDEPDSTSVRDNLNSQITQCCNCEGACDATARCGCLPDDDNYYKSNKAIDGVGELKLTLCESKFHDRVIMECNTLCACYGKMCGNRLVQCGPISCLKVTKFNGKGYGVVTERSISKGMFICEYAGEVITKTEALRRQKFNRENGKMNYIFCLTEHAGSRVVRQTFVDPSQFGNIGRYLNHSCDPNCTIVPVIVDCPVPKLCVFACKHVEAASELTFDYGAFPCKDNGIAMEENLIKCYCGSANCKQWLPYDEYSDVS